MPRKIPKLESKHQVAVKLGAEFNVKTESALQWFDSGCPVNFEEAKAWKLQRIEEAKIRSHRQTTPCKYEKARSEAINASNDPLWDMMSPDFQNLCDVVCDLFLVGLSCRAINGRLGVSEEVVHRIISKHPRTKDKDKEMASSGWADIRRLAQEEIRERLRDPDQRAKIKPADLNFLAGTAHDKLTRDESPQQAPINIKNQILAMSHNDIIEMIEGKKNAIEGEFKKEGEEMSRGVQSAESKPPLLIETEALSDANYTPKQDK